ncbi:hypothetical protein FH972_024522 [Carpinus fangiana]|uniref:Uncharacterized protein n=1 Tax=Carpinus fangiana TaxID=176857 RepID=A0A5N6KY92_9ROSI|nr:hypothetical protein FH972_024522 [Carpinus fangiana]
MKIGHEHGRGFNVTEFITGAVHVVVVTRDVVRRGVEVGKLFGLVLVVLRRGLRTGAAFALILQRGSAIFGMHGAVVAKEEISPDKRASALHTLEGPFLCVWQRALV